MFCLHNKAGDRGSVVHVGPQSPAIICNWAPQFPHDKGEGGCPGSGLVVRDAQLSGASY